MDHAGFVCAARDSEGARRLSDEDLADRGYVLGCWSPPSRPPSATPQETPSDEPSERTAWNVRDSDAVLVLSLGRVERSAGTAYTLEVARELGRSHLVAHPSEVDRVRSWLAGLPGRCALDVAGPRESEEPGLYAAAYALLLAVLSGTPGPG